MDFTSGDTEKKQMLLEMTVECPRYKAMCLSIAVEDCKGCEHHKGVVEICEVKGVKIYDVVCVFPFHRRVTRLIREIREVNNAGAE